MRPVVHFSSKKHDCLEENSTKYIDLVQTQRAINK